MNTKFERMGCAHSLFTAPQYNMACHFSPIDEEPSPSAKSFGKQALTCEKLYGNYLQIHERKRGHKKSQYFK